MNYVPPFDRLKTFFEISCSTGELRFSLNHDGFVAFIRALLAGASVDSAWYLRKYPDVAKAVQEGHFSSAKHHFIENGYFEGRFPCEPAVDEAWYLAANPDVAENVRRGEIKSGLHHFIEDGYREGRLPSGC